MNLRIQWAWPFARTRWRLRRTIPTYHEIPAAVKKKLVCEPQPASIWNPIKLILSALTNRAAIARLDQLNSR